MHKGETVERLEWKIDEEFSDGTRWELRDSNEPVGRVFKGALATLGVCWMSDEGDEGNVDTLFPTMKEAAQYVVAEYKAWQAKNQSSTGTDAK